MLKLFRRKPVQNQTTTTTTTEAHVGTHVLSPEEDPDVPPMPIEQLLATEEERWAKELNFGADFMLPTEALIEVNEKLRQIAELQLDIKKIIIKSAQEKCHVNQVIPESAPIGS